MVTSVHYAAAFNSIYKIAFVVRKNVSIEASWEEGVRLRCIHDKSLCNKEGNQALEASIWRRPTLPNNHPSDDYEQTRKELCGASAKHIWLIASCAPLQGVIL